MFDATVFHVCSITLRKDYFEYIYIYIYNIKRRNIPKLEKDIVKIRDRLARLKQMWCFSFRFYYIYEFEMFTNLSKYDCVHTFTF